MSVKASRLLDWYQSNKRDLPWRNPSGRKPNVYHIWLSEIMLQQTTVASVIPYYNKFLELFPTIQHLAEADQQQILTSWSGLGYYSRARNLYLTAQKVIKLGGFPLTISGLKSLPGIGDYTASAIAALAFSVPVVPVDVNIERLTARIFAFEGILPKDRKILAQYVAKLNKEQIARNSPADFVQALFDLGALVCTARTPPSCHVCPWSAGCEGLKQGIVETLPRKKQRRTRPLRFGIHYFLEDRNGNILLCYRHGESMLADTVGLPGCWRDYPWEEVEIDSIAPFKAQWNKRATFRYMFTHFELQVDIFCARISMMPNPLPSDGFLCSDTELSFLPWSTLMRKCLKVCGKIF